MSEIKSNYAQISILIIGILITASWVLIIVPDLKNDFSAFEEIREQLGNDAFVEFIGGKLSTPDSTKDLIEYEIVNVDGDIYEIKSSYTSFDLISGEKIYENIHTYFIDHKTRKHVGNEEYYFIFPLNVQKQNYLLLDPTMEVPATFVFEEAKYIDDLEVYVFSCETFGDDLSSGYAEFAPTKIYADQTCKTSIEPITGKTVEFGITWDIYSLQDGSRLPVEIGGTETTDFTEQILLQSAKETKNLFSIFDYIIPTFMLLILGGSCSTSVYIKKSREKTDAIKKAQHKIEMDEVAKKQKTKFISMITHELKTPLTPIIGFSQSLMDSEILGTLSPKQRDAVEIILKNANSLKSIIGDLLDSHRLELKKIKFSFTEVDVVELIHSVINNYKKELESKKIHVIVRANPPMLLTTDKLRVEQVLTNIFVNSIDFVLKDTGKIVVSAKLQRDSILFTIQDNGSGIPPEEINHIFDSFSQIDTKLTRKHGGSGLGLTICRSLVTKLGGKIWVESELGKGATFYFTISQKAEQMDKSE